MISNITKASVLRSVIAGANLSQAARAERISPDRARIAVARICELLHLRSDIATIQSRPEVYLEALARFEEMPHFELRTTMVAKLRKVLALRSSRQLTPTYLACITASRLINQGMSVTSIADIQDWLLKYDLSLCPSPPETELDFREVKKAIALLDAFGLDIEAVEWQMRKLEHKRAGKAGGNLSTG